MSILSDLVSFALFNAPLFSTQKPELLGRGGSQVVSVLAFDNPRSNPADIYNFSMKLCLKRTKINIVRTLAGTGDQTRGSSDSEIL